MGMSYNAWRYMGMGMSYNGIDVMLVDRADQGLIKATRKGSSSTTTTATASPAPTRA